MGNNYLIRVSETLEDALLIGGLAASDYLLTPESEGPVDEADDSRQQEEYKK